jgi:hypothetical protein
MRKLFSASLLLVVAVFSASLHGQTVDTAIVGTVTDNSGALLPGATVTATSVATGISKSVVTTATGEYTINYLLPGAYNVAVTANGFTTTQQKAVVVQLSQEARENFQLRVGATTEQVIVQAAPPLLQTQTSSLGNVVGEEETQNLPLNGRRFDDLAILTPGTTSYNPDNHTESEDGASVQSYSEQLEWGQTNVDGVTMMGDRHAYVNLYPSTDAIQEFDVIAGNGEAEYVGSAGDITNIQLKSGTNEIHGDAFDYVRNTALDARNYFIPAPSPKEIYRQNQFGGTVGGPIIKNRTFFFLSYEGIHSNEQSAGLSEVLTPAEVNNGDFSALLPGIQLVNPTTGAAYSNNQIPVNPVAQSILQKYMPACNYPNPTSCATQPQPGFNYAFTSGGDETVNQFLARVDHHLNANDSLMVHFMYAKRHSLITEGNPNFNDNESLPIWNAGLQYVHIVSPKLVNELRLGIDFESDKLFTTYANTNFTAASIGINDFVQPNGTPWPPSEEGFPVFATNELLDVGSGYGIGLDQGKTFQLVDNMTWTHGTHTLLFGGDVRNVEDNADTSNTPYGFIIFNGEESANNSSGAPANEGGFDGADLMLGYPSQVISPEGDPLTEARQWRMFYYVQHNWKATHNLTINTGINYSYWAPPRDNLNTSESLDWASGVPNPLNLVLVSSEDFSPLWHVTGKDFGPRIGFALSLPMQMVVRGGYGISYYGGQFDNINILQLNPPADPSFSVFNGDSPANPPVATIENPLPPSLSGASSSSCATAAPCNIVSLPPGNPHPDLYVQTWNLTASKQIKDNVFDITYIGVKGLKEDTSELNWNVGPPLPAGTNITAQEDRPYPEYAQMRVLDYHGASIYQGALFHYEHRLAYGLNFTASYTYARDWDNQGGGTNQERSQTQIAQAKVWANGLTEQHQNLVLAAVYRLPKLNQGNEVMKHILNGWGLNSIFQYLSGGPVFINQAQDGQNNANNFEYPDLVPGQPNATPGGRTINEWFNTARFTEAVGHYGDTPRNPHWIFAPATDPLTFEINRSFVMPFAEGQRLSLQFQGFNILNHPQFGAPNGTEGSGSFGQIGSTVLDNREVQLVAKYFF